MKKLKRRRRRLTRWTKVRKMTLTRTSTTVKGWHIRMMEESGDIFKLLCPILMPLQLSSLCFNHCEGPNHCLLLWSDCLEGSWAGARQHLQDLPPFKTNLPALTTTTPEFQSVGRHPSGYHHWPVLLVIKPMLRRNEQVENLRSRGCILMGPFNANPSRGTPANLTAPKPSTLPKKQGEHLQPRSTLDQCPSAWPKQQEYQQPQSTIQQPSLCQQ